MTFTTCDRIPIPAPALTDAEIIAGTVEWLETMQRGFRGSMSNAHIADPKQYCSAWRMIDGSFGR